MNYRKASYALHPAPPPMSGWAPLGSMRCPTSRPYSHSRHSRRSTAENKKAVIAIPIVAFSNAIFIVGLFVGRYSLSPRNPRRREILCGNDLGVTMVFADAADERTVDLEYADRKAPQIRKAGIANAEIVNR